MTYRRTTVMLSVLAIIGCASPLHRTPVAVIKPVAPSFIVHDGGEAFETVGSINHVPMPLTIDTGSTFTAIPEGILEKAHVPPPTGNVEVAIDSLANGTTAVTPIITLPELDVGPCKLKNTKIEVVDNSFDPLLGLSTLKSMHMDMHNDQMDFYCNQ